MARDEMRIELRPERVGGGAKDDDGPARARAAIAHHLVVGAHLGEGLGRIEDGGEALHGEQTSRRRLQGTYGEGEGGDGGRATVSGGKSRR